MPIAATTAAIRSICPKCGTTKKANIDSCCGRGGSWFGNCGNADDTEVDHTWYEGLQACTAWAQSNAVIAQQLNGAKQESNNSYNRVGNSNSKAVVINAEPFAYTSAPTRGGSPIIAPAHMRANTSTVYDTLTLDSKSMTEGAVVNEITALANMRKPAPSLVNAGMSVNIQITHKPVNSLMTIAAHAVVTSQGCETLLGTDVRIRFMLAVIFCVLLE